MYPLTRMRRNRSSTWIRNLVSENNLTVNDLILPIFITEGNKIKEEIASMPGIYYYSPDQVLLILEEAVALGINAVALFPIISIQDKSYNGKESVNPNNIICKMVRMIKATKIPIGIICDVALDPYTSHGHDGIINDNIVDNDKTIEILQEQSLVLADSGADSLAPSDMMDGRVLHIRNILEKNNFSNINIIPYSAKYASNYYAPFREAINSNVGSSSYTDKRTYQMDVRNSKEALHEIELDIKEGCDAIIIKPGIFSLDIIKSANDNFNIPIFGYQVSGEYSMLSFAARNCAINFDNAMIESLICFKRAGCRGILTYAALKIANLIKNNQHV